MGIQINIRDVPEKVRDELAARAALQGKSMQERAGSASWDNGISGNSVQSKRRYRLKGRRVMTKRFLHRRIRSLVHNLMPHEDLAPLHALSMATWICSGGRPL